MQHGAAPSRGESTGSRLLTAAANARHHETLGRVVDASLERSAQLRREQQARDEARRREEHRRERLEETERVEQAQAQAAAQRRREDEDRQEAIDAQRRAIYLSEMLRATADGPLDMTA